MKNNNSNLFLVFLLGAGIMFIFYNCIKSNFDSVNDYEIIGAPINLAARRPNVVDLHNSLETPRRWNYESFNSAGSLGTIENLTGDLNNDIEWGDEYPYHIDEQLFGDEYLTW